MLRHFGHGWRLLPEPRVVTALMASWYGGCVLLGGRLLGLASGGAVFDWLGSLLFAGGLIAASACLAGQWWIERVGITLLAAAWAIRASMVAATHPPEVWVQATSLLGIAALLGTRVVRIWGMPADPTRAGAR